jgi:hypothetical protein
MDTELKQYLEDMETRLNERADARGATTEARIMQRVDGRIDAVEDRLKDFIRQADIDLETKIVGEFWKWTHLGYAHETGSRHRQRSE